MRSRLQWRVRVPIAALVAVALFGALGAWRVAEAAPVAIAGGYLDWGVKASFRSYISGPIAHGSVSPEDGAGLNGDGSYRFPLSGGTADPTGSSSLFFDGSVHFTGHDGELELTISGLRAALVGGSGTLRATVTSKSMSSGTFQTFPDIVLAQIAGGAPTSGTTTVTWSGLAATLSAQGAPAFSGFYTAGTELDPVSIQLMIAAEGSAPLPTDGSSSSTTPTITVKDGEITVPVVARATSTAVADAPTRVESEVSGSITRVNAPAGALPAGATLTAAPVKDLTQLTASAPVPPGMNVLLGLSVQAATESGAAITQLNGPVTLNFNLPVSGVPIGTTADDFVVAYWNGSSWVELDDVSVWAAKEGSTLVRFDVTVEVDHFTLFAVLASPGVGSFSRTPGPGITLTVWQGGGYERLDSALVGTKSLWVTVDGRFLGYLTGVPAFVNAPFLAQFPNGLPKGTPVAMYR